MDTGVISAIVLGSASLVTFLASQASAKAREQREQARRDRATIRRQRAQLEMHERWEYRLVQSHAQRDLPLPDKPDEWDDVMRDDMSEEVR